MKIKFKKRDNLEEVKEEIDVQELEVYFNNDNLLVALAEGNNDVIIDVTEVREDK